MEFLKKIFNSELNEKGHIEIAGYTFQRDEVLNTMDSEAYKQAFIDWKEARKTNLISKADEILSPYNNLNRFKALQNKFKENKTLPFIGAGMSMPSNYAGWTSFLYQLRADTTITESELDNLINNGEYEKAAQILLNDMPQNSFDEAISNEYHLDNDIFGAVQYLPYIFTTSVITTNFDNVLKRCYDDSSKPFSEVILGADAEELLRLISSEDKLLVKLHGKANSSIKRILTEDEYNKHYGDSTILKKSIETICSNSLLFLGCSLSTDRTIKTMIKIVTEQGRSAVPHYAFIGLNDKAERLYRRDELAKANIHPIWYDANDNHDECIEALLLKLADGILEL